MNILAILAFIFVLILPFLILFVPFILAWLKGSKNLQKIRQKYQRAISLTLNKLFDASFTSKKISPLEITFRGENTIKIQGKIWLVDRRAYFYYLAKLFKPINDIMFFSIATKFTPGCILIIVSKDQDRLVKQALGYSKQLELANIKGLDKYLILTDNVIALRNIFDSFIVREIINLRKHVLYILVDYMSPNIEFYVETNEKNYVEIIPRVLMLVKNIMTKLGKISPKKTTMDTLKMLKRSLRIKE